MGNATSSNTDLTDGATDDIPETYSETLIHITDDGQEAGDCGEEEVEKLTYADLCRILPEELKPMYHGRSLPQMPLPEPQEQTLTPDEEDAAIQKACFDGFNWKYGWEEQRSRWLGNPEKEDPRGAELRTFALTHIGDNLHRVGPFKGQCFRNIEEKELTVHTDPYTPGGFTVRDLEFTDNNTSGGFIKIRSALYKRTQEAQVKIQLTDFAAHELKALREVGGKSACVVRLLAYYTHGNKTATVTEGPVLSWKSVIHGSKQDIPDVLIRWMLASAYTGLNYLHGCGYIHANVTPSAVVVLSSGRICIGDLSHAIRAPELAYTDRALQLGSSGYNSLEKYKSNVLSHATDWWALAMTLTETIIKVNPINVWMAQIHKDIQKMPEEKRPSDFEIQVMGVIWFHKKYQYGALLYKMLKRLDLVYMLKPLLSFKPHERYYMISRIKQCSYLKDIHWPAVERGFVPKKILAALNLRQMELNGTVYPDPPIPAGY